MNRSVRDGKSVKRFERSNGPDIVLYKKTTLTFYRREHITPVLFALHWLPIVNLSAIPLRLGDKRIPIRIMVDLDSRHESFEFVWRKLRSIIRDRLLRNSVLKKQDRRHLGYFKSIHFQCESISTRNICLSFSAKPM